MQVCGEILLFHLIFITCYTPCYNHTLLITDATVVPPPDQTYECDSVITGVDRGIIQSTNYPEDYENNMNCTFQINTDPGRIIVLQFLDVSVRIFILK